jgi:hypothetical protein
MKNIHIIPTDKPSTPSRLFYKEQELVFSKKYSVFNGVNIYITSDEEIKVNDYITDGYSVWQWKDDSSLLGRKKVILATDQDLINNGVQAIHDEFLEWFVKNPSCQYGGYKDIDWDKIITQKVEPKQETLEEAAERLYPTTFVSIFTQRDKVDKNKKRRKIWIEGAKWQQEQILQFLYSEITERRPYSSSKMCEEVIKFIEQFKKK